MRILIALAVVALAGCALTPQQVVERAKAKTNTELCMAMIQFPQYSEVVTKELAARRHVCDWNLTTAQVANENATLARKRAAIQALAATAQANAEPVYKIVQPVPLESPKTTATDCTTYGNQTRCTSRTQ